MERQLQPGGKLYPNETIATSEDGLVLVDFINGTHMDLPPASQILLDDDILELATAQSEPLTVEQIQEMIAWGEYPAAIRSDNGDVLHLADILQDEHVNADSLGSYLSFAFDGQNTRLIIDVDGSGPGTSTQTVILEGVDLTANNTLTSALIITNLLADGNLKTDA